MFDLFGADMSTAVKFFIAFAVVLVLIGLIAWLVRRFGGSRLGGSARGRQPRLAVIDAATVDGRRRLVLIRRDNIEHLLMIGGPTDLVVEPNIVRASGAREPARATAEPRVIPSSENGWPLQPASEPPAAAARSYRPLATEEPWHSPEPGARPRPADNLSAELAPREPAARPMVPARAPEPIAPQTDHNLAEMALQLEAALRRAPKPETRTPVTDPLARQATEVKPRIEPKFELKEETKLEPKFAPTSPAPAPEPAPQATLEPAPPPEPPPEPELAQPAPEPPPAPAPPPPAPAPTIEPKLENPADSALDNLEQEMANLLGRPPGKL
jgi:flagellar protein FliO/FliZ